MQRAGSPWHVPVVHTRLAQQTWPAPPQASQTLPPPPPLQMVLAAVQTRLAQHGCPADEPHDAQVPWLHWVLGVVQLLFAQHIRPAAPQVVPQAPAVQVPPMFGQVEAAPVQMLFTQQPPPPHLVPGQQASPGPPHETHVPPTQPVPVAEQVRPGQQAWPAAPQIAQKLLVRKTKHWDPGALHIRLAQHGWLVPPQALHTLKTLQDVPDALQTPPAQHACPAPPHP